MPTPLTTITEEARKTPAYYEQVKHNVENPDGSVSSHRYTYMQVTTEETTSYVFSSMQDAKDYLDDFYAINPPESDTQTDGVVQRYNQAGMGEVKIIVTTISEWEVVKDEDLG